MPQTTAIAATITIVIGSNNLISLKFVYVIAIAYNVDM